MPTEASGVVIVPAIIGAVQVGKHAGLPSRYAGVLAVLLGIAAALASQPQAFSNPSQVFSAILTGVVWGLMAAGLYSGTSALQLVRSGQQASTAANASTSSLASSLSNAATLPTDLKPMPQADASSATVN